MYEHSLLLGKETGERKKCFLGKENNSYPTLTWSAKRKPNITPEVIFFPVD